MIVRPAAWAMAVAAAALFAAAGANEAAIAGSVQATAAPISLGAPLRLRGAPSGTGLGEPPSVYSTNGVAHLALTAWTDAESGLPQLRFNGVFRPATVYLRPGDTLAVHFENLMRPGVGGHPNDANLHFHGLSVSPRQPGDDVLDTVLAPGQKTDYLVHIPADHPPGLYWYHTHPHGEAQWQTGNAMSGALVIEGIGAEAPDLVGMRERVLVLRDSYLDTDEAVAMAAAPAATLAPGCNSTAKMLPPSAITVNDVQQPKIGIRPGEPQFFRVVNAAADRYFDLAVDGERLRLVEQDGVPLADAPGGGPEMLPVDHILLAPGARAEFVVVGRLKPTALRSRAVDTGKDGDPTPGITLATFYDDNYIGGTKVSPAAHPPVGYRAPLPPVAAHRTIRLSENNPKHAFYVDGVAYKPAAAPLIVARAGTVEEWTIENDSDEIHAFHLHQVHFIVEDVDGVRNPRRFWADTVTIPYRRHLASGKTIPGRVRILADFRDDVVRGTFVFHCHILDHEDGGMMAKIAVR